MIYNCDLRISTTRKHTVIIRIKRCRKTTISSTTFTRLRFQGYRSESDIAIFAWRVTWNYAYSPFKCSLTALIKSIYSRKTANVNLQIVIFDEFWRSLIPNDAQLWILLWLRIKLWNINIYYTLCSFKDIRITKLKFSFLKPQ